MLNLALILNNSMENLLLKNKDKLQSQKKELNQPKEKLQPLKKFFLKRKAKQVMFFQQNHKPRVLQKDRES